MNLIWKGDTYFDDLYWNNKDIWWDDATDILKEASGFFDRNKIFLDLWCWHWRNTFYMASEWFNVEAVDFSREALDQINKRVISEWINSVKTRCADLLNLDIEWNYWVIGVINIVSLWERDVAIKFIHRIKQKMNNWAYIVLTWYLKSDILYKENENGLFFEDNELLEIFSDFSIKLYKENSFTEWPHEWYDYPHKHFFCSIVAQKNCSDNIFENER